MAYTKAPMENTEQTKQIPMFSAWETRDKTGLKDVDNLNTIFEGVQSSATGEQYFEVLKRDGFANAGFPDEPEEIFGAYSWVVPSFNRYIRVTATHIKTYTPDGVLVADAPATFINGKIGFTEFLYDDGTSEVVVTDGTNIYLVNFGGGAVAITDPDLPKPHLPYPVFLDGYLFLADYKGNLCNSDLNAPLAWSASNFIAVESYPDTVSAIARVGQYIVALGTASIQYFYDAANPTGTPLAAQSTVLRIGFIGGLVAWKDGLIFLGREHGNSPTVFNLKGLSAEPLSEAPLRRRLLDTTYNATSGSPGVILTLNGHAVYTWYRSPGAIEPTYALDLANGVWTRLEFGATGDFAARTAVLVPFANGFRTVVSFLGGRTSYKLDPLVYQDNGVNFTASFRSLFTDFGTRRMKFGSRLIVNADRTPASSLMSISWTDDDYQTFSTPRTVDLSNQYPHLYALGSFRTRAWKFEYADNYPLRWISAELDYNQGQA